MDTATLFMFSLYGLFWASILVILIYLIFRRIDRKKKEDFEDRDN